MQAGLEQHGKIGAVVDNERRASYAAQAGYLFGGFEVLAAPVAFVADLQDASAAFQERRCGRLERDATSVERFRVEDGVRKPTSLLHSLPFGALRELHRGVVHLGIELQVRKSHQPVAAVGVMEFLLY